MFFSAPFALVRDGIPGRAHGVFMSDPRAPQRHHVGTGGDLTPAGHARYSGRYLVAVGAIRVIQPIHVAHALVRVVVALAPAQRRNDHAAE